MIFHAWNKLALLGKNSYRIRSLADENTALCWLAQSGSEAYVNISNSPKAWFDIAPVLLIARETGAILTDLKDGNLCASNFSSIVAASNSFFHQAIMKILLS